MTTVSLGIANAYQLLMYSWNGNEVTVKSFDVSVKAFQSEWIDLDEETKKDLTMIIMRAQKPCVLTAGKFQALSLETYMNVKKITLRYHCALLLFVFR